MARLTVTTIGTWLQSQLNVESNKQVLVAYARQPDMSDRVVTIYRVGAGRDLMDSLFEEVPFRFQTRGRSESLDDAEQLALLVDNIIYSIKNAMIGDVYVTDARVVNKPKQVPMTDKQSRYQFTADYLFVASRFN